VTDTFGMKHIDCFLNSIASRSFSGVDGSTESGAFGQPESIYVWIARKSEFVPSEVESADLVLIVGGQLCYFKAHRWVLLPDAAQNQ